MSDEILVCPNCGSDRHCGGTLWDLAGVTWDCDYCNAGMEPVSYGEFCEHSTELFKDKIILNFCTNLLIDHYQSEGSLDLREALVNESNRIGLKTNWDWSRKIGDLGDSTKKVDSAKSMIQNDVAQKGE